MTLTNHFTDVKKVKRVQPPRLKCSYKATTANKTHTEKRSKKQLNAEKKRANHEKNVNVCDNNSPNNKSSDVSLCPSTSSSSSSSSMVQEEIVNVHFLRYDEADESSLTLFPDRSDIIRSGQIVLTAKDNQMTARAKVGNLLRQLLPNYKGGFKFSLTFSDIFPIFPSDPNREENLYVRLTSHYSADLAGTKPFKTYLGLSNDPNKKRKCDFRVLTAPLSTLGTDETVKEEENKDVNHHDKFKLKGPWQNPTNNQDPMEILELLIKKNLACFVGVPALHSATKQIATMAYFNWLDNLPPQHPGHIVIVGNPGVGKTTGAWALARFMAEAGIVQSRTIVEAHRDDLVDRYVGGTEMKTNVVIHSAAGGVVIFDEVYTLNKPTSPNDAGKEALTTIMKYMTDENAPVFMFLGYKDSMREFVNMNPGFQRRIKHTIDLKDYDSHMLASIVQFKIKELSLQTDNGVKFEDYFRALPQSYLQLRNASVALELIDRAIAIARERALALPHQQRKGASRKILKSDFDAAFDSINEESNNGSGGNNEDVCSIFI